MAAFLVALFVQGTIGFWKLYHLEGMLDAPRESFVEGIAESSRGGIPVEEEWSKEISQMRLLWGATLLSSVVLGVVVAWWLYYRLYRNVEMVARDVRQIEEGDKEARIQAIGVEEVDKLTRSFNCAVDSLREATVRKDQLEELEQERIDSLRRFFILVPDLMCVVDEQGAFIQVNGAFEGLLGYSEEEVLGIGFQELIHPDDIGEALLVFEGLKDESEPIERFENRILHKNGSWRYLSWNAILWEGSNQVYATARDVTEERELREREANRLDAELRAHKALMELRDAIVWDKARFFARVTEVCAEGLGVERASVWQFDQTGSSVVRQDLYEAETNAAVEPNHIAGSVQIRQEDFPTYFSQLENAEEIVVEDVFSDPITRDFAKEEYEPLQIRSLLDIPIRAGGRLYGLLSCEQKYRKRRWSGSDIEFLNGVAGAILLFLEYRERAEAESKLRFSESYNRSIVESSRDTIVVLSKEGRVLDVSAPGKMFSGVKDRAEFLDMDWVRIWRGDSEKEAGEAVRKAGVGDTVRFRGECALIDGEDPRWWDVMVSPIRDGSGGVLRILADSRDITDEKRAEDQLRKFTQSLEEEVLNRTADLAVSEERFRLMIEQVEDYAIFMLDPEGGVMTWNAGAERAKGYHSSEILGKNYSCFYMPTDREANLPERLLETARQDGKVRIEGWRMRKDGSRFWAEVVMTAIYSHDSSLLGFAKVTRDLTERRAAEMLVKESLETQKELTRQAQAGERAKSDFLAVMSHELRTPMNGVLGFAELLLDSENLTEEDFDFVQTLYDSSKGLLRILDDILDFISSESGRMRIEIAVFEPMRLMEDVRMLLSSLASQKGLGLLVSVSPEVPEFLESDSTRLRQILLNLIGNALKFTEEGRVEVLMEACGEKDSVPVWKIVVRDTGVGIPEDKVDQVFEPFTQADSSSSRRFDGSGLGLSISRRLAELMGGTLELDSRVKDGSVFVLKLPMKVPPILMSPPEEREEVNPVEISTEPDELLSLEFPLRVMIVEDNFANRKMLVTMLEKLGYDPIVAVNGRDAVEKYREEEPDCIFMDLQMPVMNGVDATEEIRLWEKERKVPASFISALTANTVVADRARCFEAGMCFYLNKPVRKNTVIAVLMQAHEFRSEQVADPAGPN